MIILAMDSTAKTAAVGVEKDGVCLADFRCNAGVTHSQILLPMVWNALNAAGVAPADVGAYAVTVGPGSFTGVRIGVSCVKGLAFGRDLPCIPLSALEALAEGLPYEDGLLCPVMDARRGEVYTALFRREAGVLRRLSEDRALPIVTLAEELREKYPEEKVYLAGDGSLPTAKSIPAAILPPMGSEAVGGAALCACARRALAEGRTVTDAALAPVYLRVPQAERERLEREAKKQDS